MPRYQSKFKKGLGFVRRLLACSLAILLLLSHQAGAISPGLSGLANAHTNGQSIRISLSPSLLAYPNLSNDSLGAMAGLLSSLKLELGFQQGAGHRQANLDVMQAEGPVLRLYLQEGTEGHRLLAQGQDGPATAYLASQGEDMFGLLPALAHPLGLGDRLKALADLALPGLLPHEKASSTGADLRIVGHSSHRLLYVLQQDEALAYWQENKAQLLPALSALLAGLPLPQAAMLQGALWALAPAGRLSLTRYLDASNQDLGLRLQAELDILGQANALDLRLYQAQGGLYLSFSLKPSRGQDRQEFSLSLTRKARAIAGDFSGQSRQGKEIQRQSGTFSLKSRVDDQGRERLRGQFTLRLRQQGSIQLDRRYEASLDLQGQGQGFVGQLSLQENPGRRPRTALDAQLSITTGADLVPPSAQAMVQLDALSEAQRQLEAARLSQSLSPFLYQWLQSQPLAVRKALLHDWGRIQRTQGESVPALPRQNPFTVTPDDVPHDAPQEERP